MRYFVLYNTHLWIFCCFEFFFLFFSLPAFWQLSRCGYRSWVKFFIARAFLATGKGLMLLDTHSPPQNNSGNRDPGQNWYQWLNWITKHIFPSQTRELLFNFIHLVSNAFATYQNPGDLKTRVKGVKRIKIVKALIGTFLILSI